MPELSQINIVVLCVLATILLEMILYLRRRRKSKTSRKLLYQAKQEVRELAQLPLNNPYPLVHLSKEGNIVFINPIALNEFPDINDKGVTHEIFSKSDNILDIKEPLTREINIGEKIFHQTMIPSHEGSLIVYCLDITDRKRYEIALQRAHQLAEQSRQAEQDAKEARGEFLANMSHELRTPMNGIIGLSDILVESRLEGDKQPMIEAVNSSARNLLILLNDILDFSKIEAGELSMEAIPYDIRKVVKQIESLQSPVAAQKGLSMCSIISETVPERLIGDPSRLQQILNNLISNALKFTENGSVTISVDGKGDEQGNFITNIAVTDTGIGIPKDKQAAVFEKFQQADASTARKYGGTGLGLAITKDLAELMNGQIAIESEKGVGTTFTVTIIAPIAEAGERDCADEKSDGKQSGINLGASLMVVDDHPVNLLFMRQILTKFGFKDFDEAASGKQAVEMFKEKAYDIILMDCQMPEIDGFEAARKIREIERAENEPAIIAVTADAMKGAEDKCIAAGMDDYISKPVEKEKLQSLLEKWIPGDHVGIAKNFENDQNNQVSSAESAVFDWDRLSEFTDGDPEVEKQIVEIFAQNLEEDVKHLQQSFDDKNYEEWDGWAHKLFGACAHVGANAMACICDEAQSLSSTEIDKMEVLHHGIIEQYSRVKEALSAHVRE